MTPNNPVKWEIWLVNMPYEEGIGVKVRPALVIDPHTCTVLVGKMTSHAPRPNYPYEYSLLDWQGAGLRCQTTLRLSQIPELPCTSFLKKLGTVQPQDQVNIHLILQTILSSDSV